MYPKGRQLQKASGAIVEVLGRDVPKRKSVTLAPATGVKLVNTTLTQMVARTSAGGARDVLACVQETLVSFARDVLARPDPVASLEAFVAQYGREGGPSLFSVSPPTLAKHLDRLSSTELETLLSEQVARAQGLLAKQGLWPKEVLVLLDPTDEPYHGKYRNQHTNWGLVGQQNTYKRVFKGLGIYVNPAQLVVGYAPMPVEGKVPSARGLPAWIEETRRVIRDLAARGTTVPLVAFDRGFYSSVATGLAYLGGLVPELPLAGNPRLVCPKKFWSDQAGSKWAFLLDADAPVVREEPMQLAHHYWKLFGPAAAAFPLTGKKNVRLVPTWTIAAFDAYARGKAPKSLEWAHAEAARVEAGIRAAGEAKAAAEAEFKRYTSEVLGVERKMPAYRGTGRRRFKHGGERKRYRACRRAHERVQRWKQKKRALCQHLVFFTASQRQGETLEDVLDELVALPAQYRERWGIENGFKSVKADFRLRTNSRKTTARQARFVVGALCYNAWHYRRLSRVGRRAKRKRRRWKPFDASSPPIRRKFEREFRPVLSARGFLLEELRESLHFSVRLALGTTS